MRVFLNRCSWGVAIALAFALLLGGNHSAYGQAFATITGRALDPKGAAVPNATVTATNTETGIARTTQTTGEGLYRFENLPPGIYDVLVEASGFAKAEAKSIKLQVGEQRDVNFNLELAGQKQSVVVTSEMALVETTKTDVSTVIDDKSVADLPTTTSYQGIGGVSNDYEGLAVSAPGVKYDYTANSSDIVGPGATNSRGITVNLDGGNISDQLVSSRDALGATVEEVKEFQVLTNNYNAEYGQAGNVVLNVITKSGTNQIHGDWHSYFRGRNLGASDFFYNQTACDPTIAGPGSCDSKADAGFPDSRAPFFKHENGFTVGGPLIKDRVFWFGTWEKAAQGAPTTTTPFGTSITVSQPTNEILGSAKIDAKLTEKHLLTIRYNLQRDLQSNLLVQTGPNTDPSGFVSSVVHDNGLNIGLVSTLTPHTVNEARFYWHRFLSQTPDASVVPGETLPTAYVGADFCCPQGALQNRFQYIDNLSYIHGTHTFKMGTNISHFPYDSIFQQYHYGAYQSFSVGGCQNSLFTNAAAQNLCPNQFTVGAGPGFVKSADTIYGVYFQDTWQLTRTLTVNYGIRYDFESGAFKGGTVQDPTVKGGCLQSNGLIPACSSDKNNWQPRLGLAWSPNYSSGMLHKLFGDSGRSVIRASGAVVTEMAYLNVVLDSLNFDGKNLNTATIAAPAADCFLANGTPNPSPTPANAKACAVLTAYPHAPSATALLPFTTATGSFGRIRPISNTIKNPTIYMGSLSITRQIGPTFVWSVGYQGVFGKGLFGETDQNFPTPVADPAHPGYFYFAATGGNDRPDPLFGAIRDNMSNRTSGYNGMYVTAQKRISHHFEFQASYTFSKTLASGEDFFGLSEPANPFLPVRVENAPSQQDIRHLGNFSFVADTKNVFHTPVVNHVLNNWTFGMLGTLQSGRPYPVSTGDGAFAGSAFPALGSETNQRPNVLPNGTLVTSGIGSISGSNVLISEADVAQCIAIGYANCSTIQTTWLAPANASTFGPADSYSGKPVDFKEISGNLGRNLGLTLPIYRFDISLTKAFKIPKWESASLELKFEAFNVFNHPLLIANDANDVMNFLSLPKMGAVGSPNASFNCTSGCINPYTGFYLGLNGKALTVQDFRLGRVDKNLNPNVTNWFGLGDPAAEVTPRILQLAFRFRW
jgi:Carboxypeptidase regulatory-like domain/TonB dependent receptor-like, beta-barrel